MDIQEGDVLVVGSREYPIRNCADWDVTGMNSVGFRRMAKVTASTSRVRKGSPSTILSNVKCTPLDPVDPELRRRLGLDTPHELKQTFISDGSGFVRIVIEDLKR